MRCLMKYSFWTFQPVVADWTHMQDHLWKAINYLRDYSRDKEHRRYLLAPRGHHSCYHNITCYALERTANIIS